jgi:flavin reductase (DIM6/NTAB) family NADH-FMN oxidoreductase RutF
MSTEPTTYLHFDPNDLSVGRLQNLLQGAIAPRPIAFASTLDSHGRPNLAPFSFFNMFGANPPIVVFSPSRSGRDNTTKNTYDNVKEVPEVVINAVTYAMVKQVSDASISYPKGVNEFEMVGFTMEPSELVKPFRVKESPVQLECKVMQVIETGLEGGAGNLVICEVLRIHINPDVLDEEGRIVADRIDLVARMGGDVYCRASGNALFTLPKPK